MRKQLLVVLIILTTLLGKGETYSKRIVEQNGMLNADTAKTFMLSNESPGFLIDNLTAQGQGNINLNQVMQLLQPLSGWHSLLYYMHSTKYRGSNAKNHLATQVR